VTIAGTVIAHNQAREGGGAIFFVSNNRTGTLTIEDSALPDDPSDGFETAGFPGIFYIGQGRPVVTSSTLG
jgi:predicted outer membrane repeat protein